MEREREIEMKRAGENSDIKFGMSLTFGCDAMRCGGGWGRRGYRAG
jgi:hypothetical protein